MFLAKYQSDEFSQPGEADERTDDFSDDSTDAAPNTSVKPLPRKKVSSLPWIRHSPTYRSAQVTS